MFAHHLLVVDINIEIKIKIIHTENCFRIFHYILLMFAVNVN